MDFESEGNQEGVMDSLMEALKTGSAFNRDQKRTRAARPAGGERSPLLPQVETQPFYFSGEEGSDEQEQVQGKSGALRQQGDHVRRLSVVNLKLICVLFLEIFCWRRRMNYNLQGEEGGGGGEQEDSR